MQLLGLPLLEALKRRHATARAALDAWRVEVERASWRGPQDVKDRYATASFLADNRIIFNIKGNSFRLIVKVRYENEIVLVERVGTHAEYDKLNQKNRVK
jgi:mRNA interferase HigB